MTIAGTNGISLDRRHHDTVEGRRLDTPSGEARSGLFPDERRPLDFVGRGNEGAVPSRRFLKFLTGPSARAYSSYYHITIDYTYLECIIKYGINESAFVSAEF